MADEVRDTLIELYATHTTDELRDSGDLFKQAFGTGREELLAGDTYKELKQIVHEQKELLEQREERYRQQTGHALGDAKAQLAACLRRLWMSALTNNAADVVYKKKMDVLYDLMVARYARGKPPWPEPYLKHLTFLFPRIRDWHLFFFSYTNTGANRINTEYDAMIKGLIDSKRLQPVLQTAEMQRDSNMVAEVILQQLESNNVRRGFYDKRDIGTGRVLSDAVKKAVANSFLFVQLVTRESLSFREGNWPFDEYKLFKQANDSLAKEYQSYTAVLQNRYLFALAGGRLDQVRPQGLPPSDEYEDWYTHIGQVHYEAPPNDAKGFQTAIDQIASSIRRFMEVDWLDVVDQG
jgi:hypothetical protein